MKVKVTRSLLRLYVAFFTFFHAHTNIIAYTHIYCECQHSRSVQNIPLALGWRSCCTKQLAFHCPSFLNHLEWILKTFRTSTSRVRLTSVNNSRAEAFNHYRGPTMQPCPKESNAVWCRRVQNVHFSAPFLAMWEKTCCFSSALHFSKSLRHVYMW